MSSFPNYSIWQGLHLKFAYFHLTLCQFLTVYLLLPLTYIRRFYVSIGPVWQID